MAWLVLSQAALLYVLYVLIPEDLGSCFDKAVLPTFAMVWLAVAPLPLGVLAALTGLRPSRGAALIGLALMLIGLPLCLLSAGRAACPPGLLPFDDADTGPGIIPASGPTVVALFVFAACFGVLAWSALRKGVIVSFTTNIVAEDE